MKKPFPYLWLPCDHSIFLRGAHDQGSKHHRLIGIQLKTLRDIFQRNYPQFFVTLERGGIYRVDVRSTSPQLDFPSRSFDISIVYSAFVIVDQKVTLENQLAMGVIIEAIGPPQV